MSNEKESLTLQKNPTLLPSEDYELLRAQGIKHIEKLAGKIWTDYNTHDPGITTHELLCYAITDLGYRTSNKVVNILAEEDGTIEKDDTTFFTAAQILPCNPVSDIDFRKVLVDTKGVKNAWIKKALKSRQPFVPDIEENKLVYQAEYDEDSVKLKGIFNVIVEYEDDADKKEVKKELIEKYHKHRNLCEDINQFKEVEYENIGVCAEIIVEDDADIEQILAEIYYWLHEYFSPSINFYTIEHLLDKGKTVDEIFEGPLLTHGFLDTDELIKAELKDELRVSDMINIIMDIEGVKAVRNVLISSYDGDKQLSMNNKWKLSLSKENLAPKLSVEKSQITFYKDDLPYFADPEKVEIKFNEISNLYKKGKLVGHDTDLEDPEGDYLDLDDYYPVQNEYPLVYGIGKHGLPKTATDKRKAQAKQLKAYLLFFEQILANYLSQLSNIKNIFSIDPDINKTYYTQLLSDIRDLDLLYVDYDKYKTENEKLAEDKKTFLDRRNRVLEHLLARFCEEITDYSLFIYSMLEENASEKLIDDKIKILKEYPDLSANRGKAFNYYDEKAIWDTTNVAGMKKRVARFLGFAGYERENLTNDYIYIEEYIDSGKKLYRIKIEIPSDSGKILFTGIDYDNRECAQSALHFVLSHGDNIDMYAIKTVPGKKKIFVLLNDCGEVTVKSEAYDDKSSCEKDRDAIIKYFREFYDVENLHIVEHILLRPLDKTFDLLPVCLEPPEEATDEEKFYFEIFEDEPEKESRKPEWRFRLKDSSGDIVFKSEGYKYLSGCKHGVSIVPKYAADKNNFEIRQAVDETYYFVLIAANYEIIGMSSDFYEYKIDAQIMIDRIHNFSSKEETQQQLEYKEYEADPYSYRVSVIMPSWPEKFRDIGFRRFVENSIRLETPAHIFPRICWIDPEQMKAFELAYYNWLLSLNTLAKKKALYVCAETKSEKQKQLAELKTAINNYRTKTNEFSAVLFSLRNVYPVAKLHDCEWSEGDDPQVILGRTSLGII